MTSRALAEATANIARATRRTKPAAELTDEDRLAMARDELGRELSGNEAHNILAGLPHDHRPPPVDPFPRPSRDEPLEHPEVALARKACLRLGSEEFRLSGDDRR